MVSNDNLGNLLAQTIRPPTSLETDTPAIFRNTVGVLVSFRIVANNNTTLWNDNVTNPVITETRVQIGKGTTPPTRQDFNIENPFTNGGVEDNSVKSQFSGYVSATGLINMATQLSPMAGAGTITEVVLFKHTRAGVFLWYRNLITPSGFILGNTVNTNHEVQI